MTREHLRNPPDDLVRRTNRLAERERQTPEELIVHLLQEAVSREQTEN
jgi:hypothetical protein